MKSGKWGWCFFYFLGERMGVGIIRIELLEGQFIYCRERNRKFGWFDFGVKIFQVFSVGIKVSNYELFI